MYNKNPTENAHRQTFTAHTYNNINNNNNSNSNIITILSAVIIDGPWCGIRIVCTIYIHRIDKRFVKIFANNSSLAALKMASVFFFFYFFVHIFCCIHSIILVQIFVERSVHFLKWLTTPRHLIAISCGMCIDTKLNNVFEYKIIKNHKII